MAKNPIEHMLDNLEYIPTNGTPNEDGLPYVTHEGLLKIGELSIKVHVLNTGKRIVSEEEIEKVFGLNLNKNGK